MVLFLPLSSLPPFFGRLVPPMFEIRSFYLNRGVYDYEA